MLYYWSRASIQSLLLWLLSGLLSRPIGGSQRRREIIQPCSFPETLRTTEWPWKILSSDGGDGIFHRYRRVTFRDSDIQMDYMARRSSEQIVTTYTYTCIKALSNNKYIVSREDDSAETKYTCIQFIYRDINTYQLKFGPLERKQSNSLCYNDRLEMIDAPMVYYHTVGGYWEESRNANSTYKVCPLEGGYLVKWYDEDNNIGCNNTIEPLKLENECTKMEGLRFHSFNRACPLPHKRLERPHYCFSSWTDHGYTFMLLWQRNDDFDMPCIRYKTSSRNKITAYIFMDGICDRTTTITRSTSFRKLELERLVVPDMCSNENSLCTDHKAMPSCTSESASICRSYCKVCQIPLPWQNDTFPTALQGKWQYAGFDKTYDTITFDQEMMRFLSRQDAYTLTSTGSCKRGAALGPSATEYSLLSTYDNGCSPRVKSAIVASRSNSIISIHFSPALIAKVTTELDMETNHWRLTDDYKWWCADISLDIESDPRRSMYRYWYDVWTNVIRMENVHVTVPCDYAIPSSPRKFSLMTSHKDICVGLLHEAEGDRFNVDIMGSCTKGDVLLYAKDIVAETTVSAHQTTRYFCLASFQDNYKNRFLITQSPDFMLQVNITLLCWLISNNGRVIYWLPVSNCDTITEIQIVRKKVKPLATLLLESSAMSLPSTYLYCIILIAYWTLHYFSNKS